MSILDKNNKPAKEFLTICPRDKKYLSYNISPIPLKIVRDVQVTPDIDITVNELNKGKQLVSNNGEVDTFKITVVINRNDMVIGNYKYVYSQQDIDLSNIINMTGVSLKTLKKDENLNTEGYTEIDKGNVKIPLITVLDKWIRTLTPLYVVTNAIDIKDDYYVVIANNNRKQEYENNVKWELTFIRYVEYSQPTFNANNTSVRNALTKKVKKSKNKKKKAQTKAQQTTSLKKKLKKCDYKKLVYSKKKKTSKCVKIMQMLLINYSCLKDKKENKDGWYGATTVTAVKKFQKKYKDKYKLTQTGKINQKTFKALYTGGDPHEIKTIKLN